MVKLSKTLKVTISGSFKASDGEIESFERVTGIIPRLHTDPAGDDRLSKADQMIIKRYAPIWIGRQRKKDAAGQEIDEPKYKRVQKVRQVFIDSIEDNDDNPDASLSYVGKNIMDMNFEELQDLAAANDLSGVPLYKVNSLAHARRVAWSEYARKVLKAVGEEYGWTNQAFNPNKHEPIIADGVIRISGDHVATIEETIDRENLSMKEGLDNQGKLKVMPNVTDPSRSRLTLPQLKAIADEKKIGYHKSIGYDQLYTKIYGAKAA